VDIKDGKFNVDIKDGKFIQISELDVVFYKGPEPSPELLNDIRKANPSISRIWKNTISYKEPEPYELLKQQRDTTKRDTTKLVMAMSTEKSFPENIITTIVNAAKNNSDISCLLAISYNSQDEKEIIIRGIMERLGIDAIVEAFAKAFCIKQDEISLKHAFRGIISLYNKNDKIGDFYWGTKEISIYVEGSKGLAEVVANNLKENEKIQALVNERYVIGIEYNHRDYDQ